MNRFLSILLVLLSPWTAAAANLAAGEWFIDGDPGRGSGTAFALAAAPTATANVTISAATLNSLDPGYHMLGVRLRDAAGEWGHVVWQGFHKDEDAPGARLLAAGEWFLDADPGVGQGTAINLPANPTATATVGIPAASLAGLEPGYHLLGVRLLDEDGEWGPVVWRGLHKSEPPGPRLLAAGEWFFDEDPGPGQGTAITLPTVVSGSALPQIPVSALTPLSDGYHLLGVRTRDDLGRWGPVVWQGFHMDRAPEIPPYIASVRYRIVRAGEVISTSTVLAAPPGGLVDLAVTHGKAGLLLDAAHLLEVVPTDALGQQGHAVHADFTYKHYAAAWLEQHFTAAEQTNAAISGDDADPDGDGLSNAMERMFALDPRNAGDVGLAGPSMAKTGPADALTLEFRVPAGGTVGVDGIYRTSNLRYTARHNTHLGSWSQIPAGWISGSSLTDAGAGAARLQLHLTPGTAGRRFFSMDGAVE